LDRIASVGLFFVLPHKKIPEAFFESSRDDIILPRYHPDYCKYSQLAGF